MRLPHRAIEFLALSAAVFAGCSGCGSNSGTSTQLETTKCYAASDLGNSRVLIYNAPFSSDEKASVVLGQQDFTHGSANQGGVMGPSAMDWPGGVAVDSSGNLWVVDILNDRVLEFIPPFSNGMNATIVLGQSSFTARAPNTTQSGLSLPEAIAFDPGGNLWVSESGNDRVVEYSKPFSTGMNATLVLGQANFTTSVAKTTQSGFFSAVGMAFDSSGNLWVADQGNNRVLEYTQPFSTGMNATLVIGQSSFTTNASGTTQSSLWAPFAVAFDSSGNLWVSDVENSRVLEYTKPFSTGMNASLVLGQSSFTARTTSDLQNGLNGAGGVAFDDSGNMLVTDNGNSRTVIFVPPFSIGMNASMVLGQVTFDNQNPNQGNSTPDANTLSNPVFGVAF